MRFFRLESRVLAHADPYVANQPVIEAAISHVCRRHRLSGHEGDDFASTARLALIEDNHARIRAFSGRSSLHTYLVVVITRLFQDWRNSQWGKWRPSAEAKRLGPLAVKLETLTVRDKLTFDEAFETLRTNHGVTESRASLEALYARFPVRTGRSFTTDEVLETVGAPNSEADAPLSQAQASAAAGTAAEALSRSLAGLPPQDRLVIRMRFDDGFSVAEIAKALTLEQKPLYRRIEKLLADLRRALEASGVSAEQIRDVIADRGFDAGGWESRGEVRPFDRGPSPAEVEKVS
jgi:RNA polymerase sigma factor for flagellar operon FliA